MSTLTWIHVGDLHLDEQADHSQPGWESLRRLEAIVAEVNAHVGKDADFVFVPGDDANHGTATQYDQMIAALAPLGIAWRTIPGDHDYEPGTLAAYDHAVPEDNRPEMELVNDHRCIFLDIVSAGAGGPDFRLTMHDRNRVAEQLAQAQAEGQVPVVFMHAYPGDLAADGETIARTFIDGGVAFVDTGHTHYNELLNDGRVIYGATRSTGQIEEGGGRPGYAVVCIHGRVPSWRFREIGAPWPHVQILAPCDLRLVTRPADPHQVPRPGTVRVVAKLLGAAPGTTPVVRVDDGPQRPMQQAGDLWQADIDIEKAGLHRVTVCLPGHQSPDEPRFDRTKGSSVPGYDVIDLLVREGTAIPKRRIPAAPGQEWHAIGPWPVAGIEGTQLGPNKNGGGW